MTITFLLLRRLAHPHGEYKREEFFLKDLNHKKVRTQEGGNPYKLNGSVTIFELCIFYENFVGI